MAHAFLMGGAVRCSFLSGMRKHQSTVAAATPNLYRFLYLTPFDNVLNEEEHPQYREKDPQD